MNSSLREESVNRKMVVDGSIVSQLYACYRTPGIWGGCSPEKYTDADLTLMLNSGLIEWVGAGYVLRQDGLEVLRHNMPRLITPA